MNQSGTSTTEDSSICTTFDPNGIDGVGQNEAVSTCCTVNGGGIQVGDAEGVSAIRCGISTGSAVDSDAAPLNDAVSSVTCIESSGGGTTQKRVARDKDGVVAGTTTNSGANEGTGDVATESLPAKARMSASTN